MNYALAYAICAYLLVLDSIDEVSGLSTESGVGGHRLCVGLNQARKHVRYVVQLLRDGEGGERSVRSLWGGAGGDAV